MTIAPCGHAVSAYYSPASDEYDDGETFSPSMPYGFLYFRCGCVVRSDGYTRICTGLNPLEWVQRIVRREVS